ncbi:MAG: hypothetical protein EOO60_11105 [Hymenobacter sp.]|nr:MAG: hypothetical protein EOO60_11105 [Hymenobacter sp.]
MKFLLRCSRAWFWGLSVFISIATRGPGTAQALAPADSATRYAYTAALGTESLLYNGAEYVDYTTPGTRGHQFFGVPEAQMGSVAYRGGTFTNVLLRYDLVRDQPILLYPGQGVAIMLVPDKVAAFTLGNRHFVHLVGDSTARGGNDLPTGFYELLADGPVRLLARHSKRVYQTLVSQALTLEYRQADALFVRTATATAEVSGLRKLLALLPDHQSEVQRYARQQGLRFTPANRIDSAERLLRYYYSLQP